MRWCGMVGNCAPCHGMEMTLVCADIDDPIQIGMRLGKHAQCLFHGIEAVGRGIFVNPLRRDGQNPFDEIFHGPQSGME